MVKRARRPVLLNTAYLKKRLNEEGRSEGDIAALISDMQFFAPLVFRELSEEMFLSLIGSFNEEFGVQAGKSFAKAAFKSLKKWSTEELETYKEKRNAGDNP